MGEKYTEGAVLDLERMWEESDARTPMICFLSMGSDPTDSIVALGKRQKMETRCVSMGQGQEVHARKLLQQTMVNVSRGSGGGSKPWQHVAEEVEQVGWEPEGC
jgi:dynein heavy chain